MAGAIIETIDVDAGPALAGLKEFASALEDASGKWADFQAKLGSGLGGGGADKLAASMDEAAASISAAADKADKAAASLERIGSAGEAAGGGLDRAAAGADAAAASSDRLAASADEAGAALDRQALAGSRAGDSSAKAAEASASGWMKAGKVAAISIGIAAAYGIDKAMKLNAEVTRLYTAAGLQGVSPAQATAAVLRIGTQTGFSGQQIAEAMYHPVSAGLNWQTAQGLTRQSANLANIHGANLDDTTYAMSSVMKGYNLGAGQVNQTAAELNSIVGQGDMRFQDFNESVKNWVPTAASMGISMQSMGAGLDYLTDRGNSAEVASTRLTMGLSMATSGSKAANVYLKDLGLTTGSLDLKNKSLQATMEAGGLTTNKFAADLKKPDGLYVALTDMKTAFDKAGLSSSQADSVMAKIFGGGRSDKAIVALMQNLDGVKLKYDQIGQGVRNYGGDVAKEQATAAQKWQDFKAGMGNLATGFGNSLLPYFTSLAGEADKFLGFLSKSKGAADLLVGSVGALAALFTGKKLVSGIESAFSTGETALKGIGKVSQVLNIPGLSKLANIGGSTGLDTAAANLNAAAASLKAAAGSLDTSAGELDTSAGELDTAATKEDVGGGGVGKGAGSALGGVAMAAAGAWLLGHGIGHFLGAPTTQDTKTYQQAVPGWLQGAAGFVFGGKAASVYRDVPSSLGPATVPARLPSRIPGLSAGTAAAATANDQFAPGFGPNAANGQFAAGLPGSVAAKPDLTQFSSTLAAAMGKPVKLPPPDVSSYRADAARAGADFDSALAAALRKPLKVAPPDLTPYTAARGPATSDGANLSAGFAAGIESGKGAAVAAAADVASAAAAAMGHAIQSKSPSKVTEKIGKDFDSGFVVGLEGGQSAVNAAAQAVGKDAAKAADITTLDNTVTKMLAQVPKGDTALTKWLKGDEAKLTALANKRQMLEAEITDSQQIAQQALSNSSILNAASYTPALAAAGGPQSASAAIQGLQSMLADQKAFTSQIGQLKKEGLNATSLTQLIQGGASAGLPVTAGLVGNSAAIKQINQLEAKLHASAAKLGDEGAGPMYQAGVQAGQGLAEGIKSQLGSVDAAIKQLADSMVAEIRKDLKSHSPSLVFRDEGVSIPQGVALGVDAGTPVAVAAVGRMGSRLSGAHPGVSYGHDGAFAGGGHSVTVHQTINVNVSGSVMSDNDLANTVQRAFNKRGNNNWQTGLVLPGRKT